MTKEIIDAVILAAKWKVRDVMGDRVPTVVGYNDLLKAHNTIQEKMRSGDFWTQPEEKRDADFAGFALVYLHFSTFNYDVRRIGAQLFRNASQFYLDGTLALVTEEFERNLAKQGFVKGDIVDGIQEYVQVGDTEVRIGELPKPRPAKIRRRKS